MRVLEKEMLLLTQKAKNVIQTSQKQPEFYDTPGPSTSFTSSSELVNFFFTFNRII